MQVHMMEKIKKHCALLQYLFLRGDERYCGPPKYNVGGPWPPLSPTPLVWLRGETALAPFFLQRLTATAKYTRWELFFCTKSRTFFNKEAMWFCR